MSDFKLFPGVNLADSLSRVTGMGFENAMHGFGAASRLVTTSAVFVFYRDSR